MSVFPVRHGEYLDVSQIRHILQLQHNPPAVSGSVLMPAAVDQHVNIDLDTVLLVVDAVCMAECHIVGRKHFLKPFHHLLHKVIGNLQCDFLIHWEHEPNPELVLIKLHSNSPMVLPVMTSVQSARSLLKSSIVISVMHSLFLR